MAEPEEKWADFNPLISGSNVPGGETPAPPRGWSGAAMDTGIDALKSITSIGKQVAGVYEGAAGLAGGNRSPAARDAMHAVDTYSDIGTVLEGYKTPRGQELTRQPESFSEAPGRYVLKTAIDMAPYIPIAVGTGGVGAAVAFGALGYGQVRSDLRENLRNASPEELAKNPQYVDLMNQGKTHEQAIDEIYLDATDPRKLQSWKDAAPNVVGQAVTGGVGGSLIKGLTHGMTRKFTSEIVQKAMDRANTNLLTRKATGVAMGGASGAVAGGGQELSRQMSEQTAGQQREGIDWGQVGDASSEMATMFATMGLAHKGTPKPKVPPVGTHVEAAAADMVDAASGKTMPEGPRMKPPPRPKVGMDAGDLGGSEYDVRGDWRRPDSTTPRDAPYPPTSPPLPNVPEEMHPRDAGIPDPGTSAADIEALARQQKEFKTAPTSRIETPPPVEPGPAMHPADMATGYGAHEYGVREPFVEPVKPGVKRGTPKMDVADVTPGRPVEHTYPGYEPSEAPAEPFKPKRGSKTFTGEPEVHAPPREEPAAPAREGPVMREPKAGPEFPEVETPELPGAGDFPHEKADLAQQGRDRAIIEKHLANRDANTRGQIAAMLTGLRDEGRARFDQLNEHVQRTLAPVRDVVERALRTNTDRTIDAIRGDAVEAPDNVPRLSRHEKTTIGKIRDHLDGNDDTKGLPHTWGNHLENTAGRRAFFVLNAKSPGFRDYMRTLPDNIRREVTDSINKNSREVADVLRNREHKAPPVGYVREHEVPKATRESAAERKAAREAEAKREAEKLPDKVEFGEPAEGKTEVEHDLREEEYPGLQAPAGHEWAGREPHEAAKATEADLGLKGGKYEREIKGRLDRRAGVKLGLKPGALEALAAKTEAASAPPKRGRESMSEQLRRVLDLAEAKREARRKELAARTKPYSGLMGQRIERTQHQITEQVALGNLSEAQRKRRGQMRAEEKADLGAVYTERLEQVFDEAIAAQKDAATRLAVQEGLEDFKRWEAVQQTVVGGEKLPDFWANRARMDEENAAEVAKQLAADRREKNSDAKSSKRASQYRVRDIIAKGVLKTLKQSFAHLNDILTGVAVDKDGKYITKEGQARGERWVTEPDMKDEFKPFLSMSMHDLKQTAYAFVREAKDRIALADKRFGDASINNWKEGHGQWAIGSSVGWRRSDKGVHYNQLVDDKVFIAAVARYSGTAKKVSKKTDAGNRLMLQAIVMNHWISQKLALEGNTHKMVEFYKERNNTLREEMMTRYNVLSTSSTAGERLKLEKDLEKAKEILKDDAKYAEEQMEHFRNLDRPAVDFWQEMADAGLGHLMPEGDVAKAALDHAVQYLSNDIKEQHERDSVAERRAREEAQTAAVRSRYRNKLEAEMAAIHGEGWMGGSPAEKLAMLDTYVEGNRGEYGRPREPKGKPEPGRPMMLDDIDNVRVLKLTERAEQILDQIDADPRKASDAKLNDELRLIEDEMRTHYENAVPEARDKDFGLGRVLENGTDLSKPDNLPKGAYVRRVSDYLKEGQRGLRTDRPGGKLRNHLLEVARRALGDMEVVALTSEQMDMAVREKNLGLGTPSFYDPNTHRVFISQRVLHSADRDRILGHELAHPLTLRASELFPGIRKKLEAQLELLRDAYYQPRNRAYGEVRNALEGNTQALNNVHEFIGELYNDGGRVAQALHAIETPKDLRKAWRTDTLSSAFGDVLGTIKTGLNKLLFNMSKKKLLNDATLNSLHLFDRMEDYGTFRRPSRTHEPLPYTPEEEAQAKKKGETTYTKKDFAKWKRDQARIDSMTKKMGGDEFWEWAKARAKDDPLLNKTLDMIMPLIRDDLRAHVYDPKIWPEVEHSIGGDVLGNYMPYAHRLNVPLDASPMTIVHELVHAASSRALANNPPLQRHMWEMIKFVGTHDRFREYIAKGNERKGNSQRDYFLTDPAEFLAEFHSDPELRALLDTIPVTKALAKKLTGLATPGRSMLKTLYNVLARFVRGEMKKEGGLNVSQYTASFMEDVLRHQKERIGPYRRENIATGELLRGQPTQYRRGTPDPAHKPSTMEEVTSSASEGWKDMKFRLQRMGLSGALLKASTFVEIRRRAEEGMQHVVRGVEDVWSKVETTARKFFSESGAEDIARGIAEQMRMPPAVFQKLQDYVNLENHWKVSGEDPLYEGKNKWVSKDSPYHEHYRTRHETLSRMYDDLSPDQKELRRRMLDYYESQHDKVLRGNLAKVIHLRDMVPDGDAETTDALIKHVLKDDLSDHEKTLLDKIPGYESEIDKTNKSPDHIRFRSNMRELRSNPLFKKVEGVWYPAKRRGNHVVEGRYDLSGEAEKLGGRKVDEHGNTWEFDSAEKAQKFYDAVSGSDAYGGIHFEGKTEHVYQADEHGNPKLDSEGKPIPETYYSERTSRKGERPDATTPDADKVPFTETTVGGHRRVSAKEAEGREGTVTRHRVEFNPLLLEFYENPRHAYERHAELQGDANLKLTHVEPKRDTSGTYLDPKKASKVMETLFSSLEHGRGWAEMDPTTRALTRRDLEEAAVQHIMSTSARSMRIPRRYALGADKSLLRDFNDYAHNTSRTLAELHHRTDLSAALKNMDDYVGDHRQWTAGGDEQNRYGELRAKLQGEVHKRIFTRPSEIVAPFWTKALARVLQISYLDKLMSPGFVVLNATEPWVLGAPLLTGHHGFKAYGEIGKAYAAIGFHGVWGKGLINAGRAIREGLGAKFEDNHTLLTDRLKGEHDAADLIAMHEYGAERGYFDRDAGMEMASRMDPSTSKFGQGLDYMDNVSRQINVQIENVNRSVMAIASYRLGRQKGWSHEKSMEHAFDMVHDTSGNYGHWNTPAMFNDPRLKFALQFKRYSQRITAMYVRMFAQAFGNAPPEVKSVARKQLGVMIGSQILVSGALGLPTEPIKLALLATSPITGFGPDEAETWAREATAKLVGNDQLAEALMRGIPRAYGDIGIGTRLGHDSIWTHGTLGKKPDNWFSSLGHFMGGAPASYMADLAMAGGKGVDAIGHWAKGNGTQAGSDAMDFMQLALPFKLGADSISAARNYMGGPTTMSTAGQPLGYKPTLAQAALEASGIRSGTQQEAGDKRFALSQAKARYATEKNKAFQMYVRATPAEARSIEEAAIRNSKESWPQGMQLTHGDFYKAKRRFERNQTVNPDDVGVTLSKREAGLRDRFSFYNN